MANDHDRRAQGRDDNGDQGADGGDGACAGNFRERPSGCILLPVMLCCIIYLVNPTAGFIELIPDTFPVIGNLDEAGAVLLLLKCLGYYGVSLDWLLSAASKTGQPRK